MHPLAERLNSTNVVCRLPAASRKRALQAIASLVGDGGLGEDVVFDGLLARERLGSTGLGDGVAIPHGRFDCSIVRVAFVTLPEPVDFEAPDAQGVDLVFALVVPRDENQAHLDDLASLSTVFADAGNRTRLRQCETDEQLLDTIRSLLNDTMDQTRTA